MNLNKPSRLSAISIKLITLGPTSGRSEDEWLKFFSEKGICFDTYFRVIKPTRSKTYRILLITIETSMQGWELDKILKNLNARKINPEVQFLFREAFTDTEFDTLLDYGGKKLSLLLDVDDDSSCTCDFYREDSGRYNSISSSYSGIINPGTIFAVELS